MLGSGGGLYSLSLATLLSPGNGIIDKKNKNKKKSVINISFDGSDDDSFQYVASIQICLSYTSTLYSHCPIFTSLIVVEIYLINMSR